MLKTPRRLRILALLLVLACEPRSPDAAPAADEPAAAGSRTVATVRGQPLRAEELDARLELGLYELAERRYRLRRERLIELVAERLDAGGADAATAVEAAIEAGEVELRLEPPARPRVEVETGGAPARGAADAAVTLVVFCDFGAPGCRRLHPLLRELLDEHPGAVRLVARDRPLGSDPGARLAAEAARCAGEQDAYWALHDALYTETQELSRATVERLAGEVGLSLDAFRECLDSGRMRAGVEADLARARRLGLGAMPASFVNGLYFPGVPDGRELRRLVEEELAGGAEAPAPGVARPPRPAETAAVPSPRRSQEETEETDLPLILRGTLVREGQRSFATIERTDTGRSKVFSPGEEVMEGVTLESVERRRVTLRREGGETEDLPLSFERAPLAEPGAGPPSAATTEGEGGDVSEDESAAAPAEPAPGAPGPRRLSREAVDLALDAHDALAAEPDSGEGGAEGGLLELGEVEPGSLYDLIGLQPGDVVLEVNGVGASATYDPLPEELADSSRVSLTVLRDGTPRRLEVRIE